MNRSTVKKISDLFPDIEEGLAKGYSHAALPALGIDIAIRYYHRVFYILRHERRNADHATSKHAAPGGAGGSCSTSNLPGGDLKADAFGLTQVVAENFGVSTDTIGTLSGDAKPFRWSGRGILNKDWTSF